MALAVLFPMSVYLMLAFASFVLMYAEGATFPTVLTLPLTLVAYYLSEKRSVIVLSGWLANLMGLFALTAAAQEFFSDNPEGRLLSGAHLLVYLSWLVIFLKKTRQHYWWTIALSMLQVAVSSVLMNDIEYGFFLIVFALLGIWTVSLFTVFMAYRDELDSDQVKPEDAESGMSQRLNPNHVETSRGRALFGMPSRSIGGVEYDPHAKWVGLKFAIRSLGISFGCLFIGVIFFMCIPRLWADLNPFENEALEGIQVKFDQTVRLGNMGNILESRQLALTVQIFDGTSQNTIPMETFLERHGYIEPYFRGNSMDRYSDNSWSASRKSTILIMPKFKNYENEFRQHIELQPVGTPFLFCMQPSGTIEIEAPRNENHFFDPIYSTLLRRNKRNLSSQMIYDAYSPKYRMENNFYVEQALEHPKRNDLNGIFLQFPEERLPRVRKLSLEAAGLTEEDLPLNRRGDRELAVAQIVSFLRDSGKYTYSLKADLVDPEIDPVEDFLFNRKSGHCEYYASALALMLRSIGIPTRMVNGYKGGELDESSGVWQVQQRHAHAWVEAYYNRRWNTLDATPAAERDQVVEEVGDKTMSWVELKNAIKGLWTRYFVSMNFSYQKRLIYRFTFAEVKAFVGSLGSSFAAMGRSAIDFIKHPEKWFSLRGGLVAFILLSLMTGMFFCLKWMISTLRQAWKRQSKSLSRRRQIEFYERFLKLCERNSLVKAPQQTPREFAAKVSAAWTPILQASGLGELPGTLVEKFYAIRYGQEPLPREDEQTLIATVQKLEMLFQQQPTAKPSLSTSH